MAASRGGALGQGVYYVVTGLWPIVSMRSFEAVTGPKTDRWLVKTVGLLLGVIGASLVAAGARGRPLPEVRVLGAGSAAVLATIDAVYVARRRISPIYLLDAALELLVLGGWVASRRPR